MIPSADYGMLVIVAGSVAYVTQFNDALNAVGERLSTTGQGKGTSKAISPPWFNYTALIIYGVALIQTIDVFDRLGFLYGMAFIVSVFFLMAILRLYVLPKTTSSHFLKSIYFSMIKRYADFVKNNDLERATAIKYLIERFEGEYLGGQSLWEQ